MSITHPRAALLAVVLLAAVVGARSCSPAPGPVVMRPAVVEVELDPRGPVRAVEAVDNDELVGRVLRVSDEFAEVSKMLDGRD